VGRIKILQVWSAKCLDQARCRYRNTGLLIKQSPVLSVLPYLRPTTQQNPHITINMGVFYEQIPESQFSWILKQKMFFVGTAPLSATGHVNLSPKGGPYFGLVNEKQFWYMDLTGSGNETISHLHEPGNGRITIMFNAYEGPPKIIRLWGKGEFILRPSLR
jgi:hypothetical protein